MADAQIFGNWPSPFGVEQVIAHRRSRTALSSDGADLFWLESRPEEAGRTVLLRSVTSPDTRSRPEIVSPDGVGIRSRVHEYGGGAYCLLARGAAGFAYVDQVDQRIWSCRLPPSESGHERRQGEEPGTGRPSTNDSTPMPLTKEPPDGERWYHGDLGTTSDNRWILAIREIHGPLGITRSIVAVESSGSGKESTLCSGFDFYAAPRVDVGVSRLAWICWDHPDMSWDASELWVADLAISANGLLESRGSQWVAGGRTANAGVDGGGVSVGQPLWTDDGGLVFVSDSEGWWQPWQWRGDGDCQRLCADEAEFHSPDWQLGQRSIVELPTGSLVCRRRSNGHDSLGVIRPGTREFAPIASPCVAVSALCRHVDGAAWLGSTPDSPAAPWIWRPATSAALSHLNPATTVQSVLSEPPTIAPDRLVIAEHLSFEGYHGRIIHTHFFTPVLGDREGRGGGRPPLILICHGGPTGSVEPGFDPLVQVFTTRGFAVACVDYAGSSGYGRAYRRSLWGRWGIADVEDCIDVARRLVELNRVDGRHLAIRGTSAGGFTALCALAEGAPFAAAVSWYGVTDLLALAAVTHDFEAHYNDRLIGPLPVAAEEYERRSPVRRTSGMLGSVLVLQGVDDPVVPPSQANAMIEALETRDVDCEYRSFSTEGHGFRRAETLREALRLELSFYRRVFCDSEE